MTDFAAIDFETANKERSSVCSVGIVIVRNGEITEKLYRLIRPYPNYYSYWNTQVHGLTFQDTACAPTFPEVWKEIDPIIARLPLVAHNSPFDEGCLKVAFKHTTWNILIIHFTVPVEPPGGHSEKVFPIISYKQ